MKRTLFLLAVIISVLSSCTSTAKYSQTSESVSIKEETKELLRSKVEKMAGVTQDDMTFYLILRENHSFAAIVNMDKTKQYDFCAGTYKNNSDTLTLIYYKNYMSKFLTDRAVVDNTNKEITFLDASGRKNRTIKFLDQQF